MPKLYRDLASDLISDILYQLPVKTLLRFRCVSKRWCSQIDGPDFVKRHLSHSLATKSNLSLILKDWYLYSADFDSLTTATELIPPLKVIWGISEFFGSCDGLVALCNSEEDMALWNPSTRKYQRLPVMPVEKPSGDIKPRRFPFHGFGRDLINDDYKVVRMVQFVSQDADDGFFSSDVKVYSLKSNSWRAVKDLPYYLSLMFRLDYLLFYRRGNGVFASGALHWVVPRGFGWPCLIVAFDLAVEEFRLVTLPDRVDDGFELDLGVFEGCLCMICNYDNAYVDVWVMKEYGSKESWSKLFNISQFSLNRSFGQVTPLVYSQSRDKVLLEVDKKKLLWYDFRRRRSNRVRIEGAPSSFSTDILVGSLVPLSGGGMDRMAQQPEEEKKKSNRKQR
ncbi:F-box protein CPR30 [Morella rubra]|uniref:F-box protein CPR30 n=1 Tax=Morella rubra TaxID=262757 RepID=A0A6A1V0F2_9ROSI|nr:F-box protein CPR30 [Morella rubra]KAB1206047.1 F-box protein CPR30 [Morella rubra]